MGNYVHTPVDVSLWLEIDNAMYNELINSYGFRVEHSPSQVVSGIVVIPGNDTDRRFYIPSYLSTDDMSIANAFAAFDISENQYVWDILEWAVEPGDKIRLIWNDEIITFPYRDPVYYDRLTLEVMKANTNGNFTIPFVIASSVTSNENLRLLRYANTTPSMEDEVFERIYGNMDYDAYLSDYYFDDDDANELPY